MLNYVIIHILHYFIRLSLSLQLVVAVLLLVVVCSFVGSCLLFCGVSDCHCSLFTVHCCCWLSVLLLVVVYILLCERLS